MKPDATSVDEAWVERNLDFRSLDVELQALATGRVIVQQGPPINLREIVLAQELLELRQTVRVMLAARPQRYSGGTRRYNDAIAALQVLVAEVGDSPMSLGGAEPQPGQEETP